jgi:hypothetical protein
VKRLITRWRQIEGTGENGQWQADTPIGAFRVVEHQWVAGDTDGYRVIPPGQDCADPKFTRPTLDAARAAIKAEVSSALGAIQEEDEYPFLTWSTKYNAYERLSADVEQLTALVRPLHEALERGGRIPEWAGPDLLRGLAFWIGRAIRWSSMSADIDAAGDRRVAMIAEAINLHPAARVMDRFQCDPPLSWEEDSVRSWVAVTEVNTVALPRGSLVYRIVARGPKVYELWVWSGPAEVGRTMATAMSSGYPSDLAVTHLASYPRLRSAKGAADIDVVKRIRAGEPAGTAAAYRGRIGRDPDAGG